MLSREVSTLPPNTKCPLIEFLSLLANCVKLLFHYNIKYPRSLSYIVFTTKICAFTKKQPLSLHPPKAQKLRPSDSLNFLSTHSYDNETRKLTKDLGFRMQNKHLKPFCHFKLSKASDPGKFVLEQEGRNNWWSFHYQYSYNQEFCPHYISSILLNVFAYPRTANNCQRKLYLITGILIQNGCHYPKLPMISWKFYRGGS